jgi:lipoprotein-anchoring transpeptidase ErfK/SrfK
VLGAAAIAALVVIGAAMLVGTGGPAGSLPCSLPGAGTALAADLPAVAPAQLAPAALPAVAPARAAVPAPAGSTGSTTTKTTKAAKTTKTPSATSTSRSKAGTRATLVNGTPCTATAKACVDIADGEAWLLDDGAVTRGPVHVMTGDEDDPTPVGTFHVQWKAVQYTSRQYLVQMPYSVFFADGGVAFHEGRQDTYSGGCVKLGHNDAVAWFNYLQVGDEVQVH